mmetsp:Transcript_26771/g.75146  ORF Transcript_26771/g.75146 Transcript_26771/m.75146 type:complete len:227 (+) Transcript_26771:587-1267(+)
MVRKVVQHYEMHHRTGMGEAFLKECWEPTSASCLAFLVSPLKEELRVLSLERSDRGRRLPPISGASHSSLPSSVSSEDEEAEDELFHCPICFEVKYRPVGLACGHSFCWLCLMDASRLTTTITTSLRLKLKIADEHLKACCPMCKRSGVFQNAVELKALGQAVNARYPNDYKERHTLSENRDKIVLHAFVHKKGLKVTEHGLEVGEDLTNGWTHRRIEQSNPRMRT